ncbi:reverse transcriptase domain-containing protein [Tanacetum coccineum]
MTSIMAPWPFYQWGMDILGPLTPSRGGARFVIVAIDYFTKWVEAKPLVKITGKEMIRFVMDNIICRYGLPRIIVTDNRAHPQANGLVERANRSLMEGIKTRLGREKAGWVDELPNVLWAHHTSIKQSNGETPFSLAEWRIKGSRAPSGKAHTWLQKRSKMALISCKRWRTR